MSTTVPLEAAERLTFAQAAKLLGVSPQSIWRWSLRPNRHGIKLRSVLVGSIRFTTREFLAQHVAETTAAADGVPTDVGLSPARKKRVEAAKRELARR